MILALLGTPYLCSSPSHDWTSIWPTSSKRAVQATFIYTHTYIHILFHPEFIDLHNIVGLYCRISYRSPARSFCITIRQTLLSQSWLTFELEPDVWLSSSREDQDPGNEVGDFRNEIAITSKRFNQSKKYLMPFFINIERMQWIYWITKPV
jgi:hypothetical protein